VKRNPSFLQHRFHMVIPYGQGLIVFNYHIMHYDASSHNVSKHGFIP
jgi:hypothetical protein